MCQAHYNKQNNCDGGLHCELKILKKKIFTNYILYKQFPKLNSIAISLTLPISLGAIKIQRKQIFLTKYHNK